MPEDPFSFNLFDNFSLDTQSAGQALDELEKTFARLERILLSNQRTLSRVLRQPGRRHRAGKGSILLEMARMITPGALSPRNHSNKLTNNRFPSSGGQSLTDLATAIQRMIGRNL